MAVSAEVMKEVMQEAADYCGVEIGDLSDGFHTFNSLYRQRCVLFATLVNLFHEHSWKSRKHEDGKPCFGGGWFVVCIDTPDGPYSYHYEDKDWDMFKCRSLERAKPFDGHTDEDVGRLLSLAMQTFVKHTQNLA